MGKIASALNVGVAVAGIMLCAGCTNDKAGTTPAGEVSPKRQPSSAEKRAAAALSLTSPTAQQATGSYSESVACVATLRLLMPKLAPSPLMGEAERQALKSAALVLERRRVSLASKTEKTPAEAASDLNQALDEFRENPDSGGQKIMSCLRGATATTGR